MTERQPPPVPPEGAVPVALPPLRADLLLLHPPAVFEFRHRRDIYFPFLGTSGDVPITPLYEYFPVGFKSLERYLGERGHRVRLLNLATLLLRYPRLSLRAVVDALEVHLVGIDLHWMVHVQGALAVAARLKAQRPEVPIVLGGMSATYYAAELVRHPAVDMVMRGYDTLGPMDRLLSALRSGASLRGVPNLLWSESDGSIGDNGLTHVPREYGCGIDWARPPEAPRRRAGLPIRELLMAPLAGCRHDCPWCGSSRSAFRQLHRCEHSVAPKPSAEMAFELAALHRMPLAGRHHLYVAGAYNQRPAELDQLVDALSTTDSPSVNLEQFYLTDDEVLRRLGEIPPRVSLTLSPQSHDPRVAHLAGRGVFSNEEMEAWIERALDRGVHGIDIWYFVGMPEQTEALVMDNVEYCVRLLDRFRGRNVHPLICPMIPFLDPASKIFEAPEAYGYRLFCRTADEHRRAMERASLVNRLNYETKWLSRRQIVEVGFRAVRDLMSAKSAAGLITRSAAHRFNARIDDALAFLATVHAIDDIPDAAERERELERIGDEMVERNQLVLSPSVANQAFPIQRQVGGRWFDELGWPTELLEPCS